MFHAGVEVDKLSEVVHAFPTFRCQLLNYVHFLLVQHSQLALCNARHEIEARISRWLLQLAIVLMRT